MTLSPLSPKTPCNTAIVSIMFNFTTIDTFAHGWTSLSQISIVNPLSKNPLQQCNWNKISSPPKFFLHKKSPPFFGKNLRPLPIVQAQVPHKLWSVPIIFETIPGQKNHRILKEISIWISEWFFILKQEVFIDMNSHQRDTVQNIHIRNSFPYIRYWFDYKICGILRAGRI